jgi:subtilase family serine protease
MPNFPQRQPRNPPVASNYVRLEGSERRPARKAQLLGAADAHELVKFTIVLRRRPDGPPVPDFDHFAKTPPSQRRRLAAAEFAALYGAHPNEIAQIVNFVQSHGMSVVETHPGRRIVVATGTVAQISEAFVVTLGRYQRDRRSYQRDFKSTRGGRPQIETYIVAGTGSSRFRRILPASSSASSASTTAASLASMETRAIRRTSVL